METGKVERNAKIEKLKGNAKPFKLISRDMGY